jgi:hypothetical protein
MNRKASKIIKIEKDVKQLQDEIIFDHRLKEQYMMKENTQAVEAQKFQKKWLSKIKNVALLFYYLIIPFAQTPDWCTNRFASFCKANGENYRFKLSYDCKTVANGL